MTVVDAMMLIKLVDVSIVNDVVLSSVVNDGVSAMMTVEIMLTSAVKDRRSRRVMMTMTIVMIETIMMGETIVITIVMILRLQIFARQHGQLATSAGPSGRTPAGVDANAESTVEARQMPARDGERAKLARRAEVSGVATASAGIDASAVAVASIGASRRGASISRPTDGADAFVRRHTSTAGNAAATGTNRRKALSAGEAIGAVTTIATDAATTVETRRSANGPAVGFGVVTKGTSALSWPQTTTAVKTRRITEEILAATSGISVRTNAADGLVLAKTAVVTE